VTLDEVVATRKHRNEAHAKVVAWMQDAGTRGELVQAGQAPDWPAYEAAEAAWSTALSKLDAWIARKEQP
jgi:hypothetical protein